MKIDSERERERERERDRKREKREIQRAIGRDGESGRRMVLGVSAQFVPGAVAAIHLRFACSALACELFPVGVSGQLGMTSERKEQVKCKESKVKGENR